MRNARAWGTAARCLVLLFTALTACDGAVAAVTDRVTLNDTAAQLTPADWLPVIARACGIPVLFSGTPERLPVKYLFTDEALGDVLDELSSTYGWRWWLRDGALLIEGSETVSPIPRELAEWLSQRIRCSSPPLFAELLRLAQYPDSILAQTAQVWSGTARLSRNPAPYRLLGALTDTQAAKARVSGLSGMEMTDAQMATLSECLRKAEAPSDWQQNTGDVTLHVEEETPEASRSGDRAANGTRRLRLSVVRSGVPENPCLVLLDSSIDAGTALPAGLPPKPQSVAMECRVSGNRELVSVSVFGLNLGPLLRELSASANLVLRAAPEMEDHRVSVYAHDLAPRTLCDQLAAVVGGRWVMSEAGERVLVRSRHLATDAKEQTTTPRDVLRRLFWAVNQNTAEQHSIGACDYPLYTQIGAPGWRRWAILLLQSLDPDAPDKAGEAGRMPVEGRLLDDRAMDHLLRVSGRLISAHTLRPVYDRELLADPTTSISFTWDGKGNYHLAAHNAGLPQSGFALECDFGVAAMAAEKEKAPSWFPRPPWFLRFPQDLPVSYLEYLNRTRTWRGKLALKHIAPLAFLPAGTWAAVTKKVPEFAVVTCDNRRAMQLYAALDHAGRSDAQDNGYRLANPEWTIAMLARAVALDARMKPRSWTSQDRVYLRTQDSVAVSLDLVIGGQTLAFALPRTAELLGREGCAPKPATDSADRLLDVPRR